MKKLTLSAGLLTILAAALGGVSLPAAQALTPADNLFTDTPNSGTNMVGYHVMSLVSDPNNDPFGLSFDLGTTSSYTPQYELGVERTNTDFRLLGRLNGNTNLLQLRGDTGQMMLGPGATHPSSTNPAQLQVLGGGNGAGRDGLLVNTWGTQWNGLRLLQMDGVTKRTLIDMDDAWYIGTDTGATPSTTNGNWYLQNTNPQAPAIPLLINYSSNETFIRNGCEVDGLFFHNGSTLGFYGNTPITRPVITGSRSDGTALRSLLQNLQAQGLITDNTTP
jgi:hypothetical protein